MKKLVPIIIISTIFCSCEKVVELKLGTTASTLVIEGNITNQAGPYFVKLTNTVNFSDANTYPPVSNATVIITDNIGTKDTLTYTGNGIYKTSILRGIEGRTYFLTVIAEGKTYTAQSAMPQNVILDSLKYNPITIGGETQHPIIPIFTDPIALGNNYHFVVSVNNVLDKTYLADNDNINNGQTFQIPLFTNDIEVKRGDTVKIEMQCVDANAYTYYFTLALVQSDGATPGNPPNGITGGALGLFSAYTTQTKTIAIP